MNNRPMVSVEEFVFTPEKLDLAARKIRDASNEKFIHILEIEDNFKFLYSADAKLATVLREKLQDFKLLESAFAADISDENRIALIRKLGREFFQKTIINTAYLMHFLKVIPANERFSFFELFYKDNQFIKSRVKDLFEISNLMPVADKNKFIQVLPSEWLVWMGVFVARLGKDAIEEMCRGIDDTLAKLIAHPVILVCTRIQEMTNKYKTDAEQIRFGIFAPFVSSHHLHLEALMVNANDVLKPLKFKCKTANDLEYANQTLQNMVAELEALLLQQVRKNNELPKQEWLPAFVNYLNEHLTQHHYSRLLAVTLKAIYAYEPASRLLFIPNELRELINLDIKTPDTATYRTFTGLSQIGQHYELQPMR